ncbi:MAG: twin-arginine translocation signal domain-containing protein [Opitutus sp.]|nr:twin-arginine translocation signal domain-containing protein [Opitutus sp.]
MPESTRREFLKATAVAGAAVTLGEFSMGTARAAVSPAPANSGPLGAGGLPPAPSWIDQPMRWAQLTLVEDDPGKFDLQFWLDYFQRTRSDAVCLSGGGCVAYYPTKIPLHHRSAWLGDRDVLGELIAGCRKLGMVVIARTDPHATYDDVEVAHPDWIHVTAEGQRRRHWASPEMWVTCALGPYNFDFMTDVKRELMSMYRIDGIFINRWDGSGQCYCEHCRKNFHDASGHDLPRTNHPQDPARRAYILWRQDRLFALWRKWDDAVRAINPDSCVIPNGGGGATSSLDMTRIGALAPTLMADRQARRGVMPPWANGRNGKEFRATMGRKPIIGIFSVGLEEPYRWKDSVQNPEEIRAWAIDGIANGLRPWFTKFAGSVNDPRWLKPVEELYGWCHGAERYLRNERPLARVGVVYSQQTAWFHGGAGARDSVEDAGLGWYHALIEARVPFELVHDRLLDAAHLAAFKTLILPNIAALSDAQCEQLRAFVQRGGGLVATYETSLYDEWGVKRKDFGLADLFGASFAGKIEGPMHNAYLRLEHGAVPGHPLLRGLEDAPRVVHGVWRLEVTPKEKSGVAPLTLIPSYPDLPMEKVFPRVAKTEISQVFLKDRDRSNESNRSYGRVVYFPWDIDRTFWEVLDRDHGRLLANAVAWATNEPAPVSVVGRGVLDVTVWQQAKSVTVHLVNLTNPMMMKGPIREVIPITEQQVRVRLPDGLRAKSLRLLVANTTPPYRQTGEWVEVTVPAIAEHEVVAVDV